MEHLTQAERLRNLKSDATLLMATFADTRCQRAQLCLNPFLLATRAEQILAEDPDLHRIRLWFFSHIL